MDLRDRPSPPTLRRLGPPHLCIHVEGECLITRRLPALQEVLMVLPSVHKASWTLQGGAGPRVQVWTDQPLPAPPFSFPAS